MGSQAYHVLLWVLLIWPSNTTDLDDTDNDFSREDNFMYRNAKNPEFSEGACMRVHPSSRDINKRFHAILPYGYHFWIATELQNRGAGAIIQIQTESTDTTFFKLEVADYMVLKHNDFDKDHSNSAFLHKFRATVHGMSEGEDLLDKEAAFYAAVLTPLVFLQNYRDTWCLLERFHRALRLYQISHPTEKRSSLKLLQNFRSVNHKVRIFVWELPGSPTAMRSTTTTVPELDEEEIHDKRDIRYLKELVKNLG